MARASSSAILGATRGRVGHQVVVLTRSGLAVRSLPRFKQYPSPAAADARARLTAAAAAWNEMPLEQVVLWREYAKTIEKVNPVNGARYHPGAYNAFCELGTRFLQANPGGELPLDPPTADFAGDSLLLSVEPTEGGVRFVASQPNASGVVTELMIQKLANIRRAPVKFYKEAAIHAFTPGLLEYVLPLDPGPYAFAYRFIQAATGLDAEELLLGVLEVS